MLAPTAHALAVTDAAAATAAAAVAAAAAVSALMLPSLISKRCVECQKEQIILLNFLHH